MENDVGHHWSVAWKEWTQVPEWAQGGVAWEVDPCASFKPSHRGCCLLCASRGILCSIYCRSLNTPYCFTSPPSRRLCKLHVLIISVVRFELLRHQLLSFHFQQPTQDNINNTVCQIQLNCPHLNNSGQESGRAREKLAVGSGGVNPQRPLVSYRNTGLERKPRKGRRTLSGSAAWHRGHSGLEE